MAKDTRNLYFKDNSWHFDFRVPSRLRALFKKVRPRRTEKTPTPKKDQGPRIRHSLNTPVLKEAQALRDKYLMPIFASSTIIELVETALQKIEKAKIELDRNSINLKGFLSRKDPESTEITIRQLCDYFLQHYRKTRKARGSVGKFESTSNAFCGILGPGVSAENISKEDLIRLRDILLSLPSGWQKRKKVLENFDLAEATPDEKTINPNTVFREIGRIKSIFDFAINDSKLVRKDNPASGVKIEKVDVESKIPPQGENIEKLCNMPYRNSSTYDEHAWRMLPIFARFSSCRIGELSVLKAEDLIEKQGVLCLKITAVGKMETQRQKLKTSSSERLVPVSDKLKPYLKEVLRRFPSGYLFPNCGHCYDKDGKIFKAAHHFLKDYNNHAKKIDPRHSFHCWRSYGNSLMIDAGVDILDREYILGHKSDRVQRAYTVNNLQRLLAAVNKIT